MVTIQFREFGVRLTFTPTITPRGTIHLEVAPKSAPWILRTDFR